MRITFDVRCTNPDCSHIQELFLDSSVRDRIREGSHKVPCSICESETEYIPCISNMIGKAAHRSGVKRSGWKDMRQAMDMEEEIEKAHWSEKPKLQEELSKMKKSAATSKGDVE